jgi:5-methylcytosine-specific restriction endonuclease McrA
MKPNDKIAHNILLNTAKAISDGLLQRRFGTRLKVRRKLDPYETDTNGWGATVGYLGKGWPSLEIWYDRFSGSSDRRLYAGFLTEDSQKIDALCKLAKNKLSPVRTISDKDIKKHPFSSLTNKLARNHLNMIVREDYDLTSRNHFLGIYDSRTASSNGHIMQFADRAVGLFVDVARLLPGSKDEDGNHEVYPRCENRKWVKAHTERERSGFIASQCKERDGYRCRVCERSFIEMYGSALGSFYAEAHHLIPLGKLPPKVKTKPEDLVTVCANCHRMLHRLEGKPGDLQKLKAIYRKHSNKRKGRM